MSTSALQAFIDRVRSNGHMTVEDLRILQRDILPDGVTARDEADLLIALDRSDIRGAEGWAEWLTGAVVAYAVWTERRTGYVDADAARWLIASLSAGRGPSDTARRIAFEVVKEAQRVDESLLAFVMKARCRLSSVKDAVDLAA